jgi:fatty-acyl-CoA synthase
MPVKDGLSHWVPDPEATPTLRDQTVGDLLDEAVGSWPDREAVVYAAYDDLGLSVRWSYAELHARALAVARGLVGAGFEPGDRIAIWATNRPEWLEVQFGAAYAGVVLVPLNPLYRRDEVAFVLGKTRAAACFLEPENRGADLWAILADVEREVPSLRLRVALGAAAPDTAGPSLPEWVDAHAATEQDAVERRRAAVRPQDTSQIQFTSGTTGFPKGAELHHVGLANNARLFAHRARMRDGGRHCNPMPYFHCGGCVMSTLGSVATGSAQLPTLTFDAGRVAATIEQERATSVSLVPTMMIAVDEEAHRTGARFEDLDVVVTGGAPVPVDVERRWIERYGTRFAISYGMTEASPVVTLSDPDDPEELQIATCGTPLPHVEVDVVDVVTREPVPLGEQGELRSRGIMVMKGYWDEPAATADTIEPGGWLRSGDLARMDEHGYVSITGRAKEMIIRGGENIYPAEIEDALRRLDAVADASVVGVPDERYGEQVAAFVRLEPGATLTLDAMREQLAERIARYKIPRYLTVVEEWPTTPSGKIQKFRLREQFAAARPDAPSAV